MFYYVKVGGLMLPIDGLVVISGQHATGKTTLLRYICDAVSVKAKKKARYGDIWMTSGPVDTGLIQSALFKAGWPILHMPSMIAIDDVSIYRDSYDVRGFMDELAKLNNKHGLPFVVTVTTNKRADDEPDLPVSEKVHQQVSLLLHLMPHGSKTTVHVIKGRRYVGPLSTNINVKSMATSWYQRHTPR